MRENQHTQAIPPTVLPQVQTKIDEAKTLIAPYILALTPTERQGMPKMGEKTINFVEKAFDFARQNLYLVPSYLAMEDFGIDLADAHGLWALLNSVHQLAEAIDDTEMIAGSEAYQAALVFYHSVKAAAAQDVPGAKAIYEELKTRFPGGKRKSGGTETETVTETIKKQVSIS